DQRGGTRFLHSIRGIERFLMASQQLRQLADDGGSPWRALVDIGVASRDGLGIGPATLIAALCALGLREQRIDRRSKIDHGRILNRRLTETSWESRQQESSARLRREPAAEADEATVDQACG